MPNPNGTNQFDRFAKTAKHGDAQKLAQSQKAAPMSGAPVSALTAPIRAKRHATGQDRPRGASQPAGRTAPQPDPPPVGERPTRDQEYAVFLADAWGKAAALPGASSLVKQYAEEAAAALG